MALVELLRAQKHLSFQLLRTQQLNQSHRKLLAQMDERQQTEARLHQMHDELVQANKLALLGQVTAGVAHEINQPLAAIRNYADNALTLLQRADTNTAGSNLRHITRLADRIGNITSELRSFARKRSSEITSISLADALAGALMLTMPRMTREHVQLNYQAPPATLSVRADRIRLEQVFVNLLQNALDAMASARKSASQLDIHITPSTDTVSIYIQDNGPGLSNDTRAQLFMPFHTTKVEGLGLGLVISRDLLTEFGGTLQIADPPPLAGGACFVVTLQRAAVLP